MQELAQRLSQGEMAAFAELYDRCADRLYAYLRVRLGRDDAADALQETFVRLAGSLPRFPPVANPIAYAFGAARNVASRMNQRRRRERQPSAEHAPPLDLPAGDEEPAREMAESIRAALSRLTDEQRETIELKHFGGLTFQEIAEATGTPQGTVASRYRRAVEQLRGRLAKEWS